MALGEERHEAWQDVIDVNLTGVFNTVETAIPSMIERGQGGAIVLTSSTAGINGIGGATRGGLGYTAAKHGVVGLMRSYANILAPHSIRVNTVHPTGVNTPMVVNEVMQQFLESGPGHGPGDGQRAAGRHGRAGGHLQRDPLAGLRRRPLRHRHHACRSTPASRTRSEVADMAGRVAGKVAFITGAARGQGRSHAVRLAQEGADIIAVDVCEDMPGMPYAGATEADLAETVKEVEALDRRIVAAQADVRDYGALKAALDDGVAQLGRLDIVSANAGHRLRRRTRRRTWPSRPGRT